MLALVTPLRAVFGLALITVLFVAWPHTCDRRLKDWHVGIVEPGSIEATDYGYRFTLLRRLGSEGTADRIVVRHEGALDNTVCDGAEVYVSRFDEADPQFSNVAGFHDGKYDHCWQLRCDDAAYAQCRGPDHTFL